MLLLVARDDRKMRIEVGYGLEGTLTDLHSKLIIENTMVPAFRAGDFSGGISARSTTSSWCWRAMPRNWRRAPSATRRRAGSRPSTWFVIFIIDLGHVMFFGGFAVAILAPIFGKKLGPNRYRWLGMDITYRRLGLVRLRRLVVGRSVRRRLVVGSSGGGFSGGGGSSGGGGASGSW
jgi:uncharacterized protein